MPYTKRQLIDIVCRIARENEIDPTVVCAICDHETGGTWNIHSVRFEPGFLIKYGRSTGSITTLTTAAVARASSWGLMQIMGQTAEEFGFKPVFPAMHVALCDPEVGVKYGCLKLKHCMDRTQRSLHDALLCYNGGSNKDYPSLVTNLLGRYNDIAVRSG